MIFEFVQLHPLVKSLAHHAAARIAAGDWALEGRRDAVISRVTRTALKCTVRVGDGAEREVAAALTPILITALHPRREEVVVAGELGARSGAVVDVTSAVAGLADTPGDRAGGRGRDREESDLVIAARLTTTV